MSEFSISIRKLDNVESMLEKQAKLLQQSRNSVISTKYRLSIDSPAQLKVKAAISRYSIELKNEANSINEMVKAIKLIEEQYSATEKQILGSQKQENENGFNATSSKNRKINPAFDEKGQYGGDQGSPREHWRKVKKIVKKYHPEYNNKQIKNFLSELNSEGCGYVAMANTLFAQYVGREDEFEKNFGFPMYIKRGFKKELNFDALVTDFYAATDNHVSFLGKDIILDHEKGTMRKSREYRWEMYIKQHNIDVDVKDIELTPKNFGRISKDGEIVVGLSPVDLYDKNGKLIWTTSDRDAGHAMTVTGVSEDGTMYKVSSWGKEYYIKKDGYKRMQFQQVVYK